jgi:hypothetical protein
MASKRLGRPATGSTKTKKSVTIDDGILAAAETLVSGNKGMSLSSLVETALEKFLATKTSSDESAPKAHIIAFPEIPMLHAAAGEAIASHAETYQPSKDAGPGRFAVQLHGDSMWPKYPDGSIVILREKRSLKRPVLKQNEIYLFDIEGEKTLKIFGSRAAKKHEIERGISYSALGGKQRVRVLLSINKEFPEILVESEDVEWLGWLDKDDNK